MGILEDLERNRRVFAAALEGGSSPAVPQQAEANTQPRPRPAVRPAEEEPARPTATLPAETKREIRPPLDAGRYALERPHGGGANADAGRYELAFPQAVEDPNSGRGGDREDLFRQMERQARLEPQPLTEEEAW